MMSNGEIAGRGKPEIYINNKKVRNEAELERLSADEILLAEIITNPGVEYGAEVTCVIKLKTIRKTGEGWSGNFSANYSQGERGNSYFGMAWISLPKEILDRNNQLCLIQTRQNSLPPAFGTMI